MQDPNRFNLPVGEFIAEVVREKFPNMNLSPGGAFFQAFIKPAAVVMQPFRDRLNLIKRNQSLANYSVMTTTEMDRRALNFLVTRQPGTRAYGVQRVFFDQLRSIYIDTGAVFSDDQDHRWTPVAAVSMTAQEVAPNYVAETDEYFVDVTVVAEADGEEYRAEAGQVNQFSNIIGASRTINPTDYFRGDNQESNSELFARLQKAITNKDLVKRGAIADAIMDSFPSVRDVMVIGMGDPEMTRDVVEAVVAVEQVLRYSFCRKVNLPLDVNGEVSWYDAQGNPIISPLGGYVGALVDVTGINFNQIMLSFGQNVSTIISAQPGFRAVLRAGYPGDPDEGEFTVTRVEEVSVDPGGGEVKVLRLNRPFSDPLIGSWNPATDLDKYGYTLYGSATTTHFHVGGKIDAYIDSTSDEEDSVIINVLPEITPGFSEIPITAFNPPNPSLGSDSFMFENNKPFRIPVLGVLSVLQVDFEDDRQVERELLPDIHYVLVRAESRGRFTQAPDDLLIIKGFEEDGVTPAFTGRRIKINYTTNPDIPLVQAFVNTAAHRDVSKDILIKSKSIAILDIEMTYEGALSTTAVDEILSEYIRSKGFGGTVTVHEINTLLALFGVTKVHHPVQLRLRRDIGNGVTESEVSEDALTSQDTEVFYPADTLSLTRT